MNAGSTRIGSMARTTIFCLLLLGLLLSGGCAGDAQQTSGDAAKTAPPAAAAKPPAAPAATFDIERSRTLLDEALAGNSGRVGELLRGGADPNFRNLDDRTPLMLAAFDGHGTAVEMLLEHGAEVDSRDPDGRTALMYAASGPFPETVRILLEHGADPLAVDQEECFTALMFAASEGHAEVVRILLENGSDPAMVDADGETALDFAMGNRHTGVVSLLQNLK